jgi:enamine deaminase RidA (YjgF/YER057c/UK114 family)
MPRLDRLALALAVSLSAPRVHAEDGRIRHVQPPALENNPRYSHAVVVESGPLVFVSGQIAHDAEGRLVGKGDMRAQARQAFENLKIALAAAGSDFAHVVRINAYLSDMNQLAAYRETRQEYFGAFPAQPASTLVGVVRLADPDLLLEVEAVAVPVEKKGASRPAGPKPSR